MLKIKKIGSTFVPIEVNSEITMAAYIPPLDKAISMVWYLLVLDMNGLLCITQHVLSQHKRGPFVHPVRCGNKMVCPQPTYYQFLTLYVSRFDIGIWSSTTQTILTLIVQLLLREE